MLEIGNLVKYWRGVKSGEPSGQGEIESLGEMCGNQVAWIKNCRGCIAITHLEKIEIKD